MYTTCAFCNGKLDGDGGPSGLGVGRRIAFDEWKGRLWGVCPRGSRWNFTPVDDPLGSLGAVAAAARPGRIPASPQQVGPIRGGGQCVVPGGKPTRRGFAAG